MSSSQLCGHAEVAAVLGLERLLDLGAREPVLAVDPGQRVAHRRQRPVLGLTLGPSRVVVDRRRQEIIHRDALRVEEVVELDVVAVLGAGAEPLAVADHQVAELAARVELVEEAVGEVGPGHELEVHLDAARGGEVLGQLGQRVGRVPGRPAQRQRFILGLGGVDPDGEGGGSRDERESRLDHGYAPSFAALPFASRLASPRRLSPAPGLVNLLN